MNKTVKRIALLTSLLLMLIFAAAASAAVVPYAGGMDRIKVDLPGYIKLAKEPELSTVYGMTVLNVIIDTENTDWSAAALKITSKNGGMISDARAYLSAPKNSGIAANRSVNTGFNGGDEPTTLEELEERLINDGDVNPYTEVSRSSTYANYSPANNLINTYEHNNGWENNYSAVVVEWLDANNDPVGNTEVLLVNIVCDKAVSKTVNMPRIPASRLYGAAYANGAETGLYPESVAKMDKKDGVVSFTIPSAAALVNNQVLLAVATPDGTDNWDCTTDQGYAQSLTTSSSVTGSDDQFFALFNLPINDPNGLNSTYYVVTFARKDGSASETTRLDMTAICGESKPWLYYTGWTPASSCALPWNNEDYDFGFVEKLKMDGWYHFEMADKDATPTAAVMEDPEVYRPAIFGPSGAVYYKAAGSSIMTDAFFSNVDKISSRMAGIERSFENEEFSEVEGPMRAANFPGVVWPMDPKELEMNGKTTTVYLPSFYAGEGTINYYVFRWYDADYEPIETSFFLCTTDTFYDLEYSKVEAELPADKREYPVLVTNHGPTRECTLVVETYPQDNEANSVYYELYLIDENGERVSHPGATTMELLLPYPDGYSEKELAELEFAVTHYDSKHNVKESFSKNTVEYKKNGILIKIFDLSPFLMTWEKPEPTAAPEPTATPVPDTSDLPKTGDNSNVILWSALAVISMLSATMLVFKRKEA